MNVRLMAGNPPAHYPLYPPSRPPDSPIPISSSSDSFSRQRSRTFTNMPRNTLAPGQGSLYWRAPLPRGAGEGLGLRAGLAADELEHRAAAADQDALLVVALDQDRAVDPHQALLLLEGLDHDARDVRDLLARVMQDPLAHHLGHEEALGQVGQEVLGIEPLALAELRDEHLLEAIDVVAVLCRDRHDVVERPHAAPGLERGKDLRLRD